VFGFGSRNPQWRMVRIGLLAAVLLAGVVFHERGPAYTTIRVLYFVVIFGALGFFLLRRSVAKRRGSSPAADAGVSGPATHRAVPPQSLDPASSVPAGSPQRQPGWFPDQQDMKVQRYWDGSAWTATRRWEDDRWVDT
jgi:Protein of unknown function (DUF2510)